MIAAPMEVAGGILVMTMAVGVRRVLQRAEVITDDAAPAPVDRRARRARADRRAESNGVEQAAPPRQPVDAPVAPANVAVTHLRRVVDRLLEETPGDALCDACLAFAAAVALIDMRVVADALPRERPGVERGTARCENCRRETIVTVFRAPSAV